MKIMLTQKPGHECSKQLSLKYLHTVTKPRVFQWVNGQSRLWSIHTNECYSSCNNLSEYPNNYTEKKVNPQILHYTIPLTFHSWSDKIIKNKEQVSGCSDKDSVKMQRGKLDSFHYTKISFKWIKDLNIKAETIKLLEENIMKKASWQMALAVISWIWHQKHRWQEKKNRQMEWHQTEKLLHSKWNNQQNKKMTSGMGENISNLYICMVVRKQQLELDTEQQTGSK